MSKVGGGPIYEIYVDMYFLINFWMNLWVLFLCRLFLHSKVKKRMVILYALIGTIGEVGILCVPLFHSSLKIVIGYGGITALVCFLLFRPKKKQHFYKVLIYCYFSASLVGGVLIGLESIVHKKLSYTEIVVLVTFLVLWIEIIHQKRKEEQRFCEVKIHFSGDSYCKVMALIDTGNGLVEPISNVPVSIVEEKAVKQYKHMLKEENFRIVPFHSIGMEKGFLEGYFIEKMEIYKKEEKIEIKKPMIALTKEAISQSGKYEMILHPSIIG